MKRWWKWCRRVVGVLGTLTAVWLLVQYVILPRYVAGKFTQALREAGLGEASVSVRAVSPWRLQVDELRLGDGSRLRLQSMKAEFTPGEAMDGKVRAVELTGLRWEVRVGRDVPGGIDWGLTLPTGATTQPGTGAKWTLPELPLERLEVRDALVVVRWEGREVTLPVSATVVRQGSELQVEATTNLALLPVRLKLTAKNLGTDGVEASGALSLGDVTIDLQSEAHGATGEIKVAALWRGAEDTHGGTPWASGATPGGLKLTYERKAGAQRTVLHWRGQPGSFALGSLLKGRLIRGEAEAVLDGNWNLAEVRTDIAAERLSVAGEPWGGLQLKVERNSEAVTVDASVRNGVWEIPQWHAVLPSNPAAWLGWDSGEAQVSASFRGMLPVWLREGLAWVGVEVQRYGRIEATISGSGNWPKAEDVIASISVLEPWALTLDELAVKWEPMDVALPGQGVRVQGLAGEAAFKGMAGPGGWVVNLLPGRGPKVTWTGMEVWETATEAGRTTTQPVTPKQVAWVGSGALRMDAMDGLPWARGTKTRATVLPVLTLTTPVELHLPGQGIVATCGIAGQSGLRVQSALELDGSGLTAYYGRLTLEHITAADKAQGWAVTGARLALPFHSKAAAGMEPGTFSSGKISYGKTDWPEVSGTVSLAGGRLQGEFHTPKDAKLRVDGAAEVRVLGGPMDGQVRASLREFVIDDPTWLGKVVPEAATIALTGRFDVHGVLSFVQGRISPWVTVDVADGAVASREYDLEASGITAELNIDSLDPVSSPPFQWVTVAQARLGKLQLADGLVQYSMQTPRSVLIEKSRWRLGREGTFWVHGLWIDPQAEKIDLEVFLEKVNIKDVLAFTVADAVTGDGVILDGRVTIPLRPHAVPMYLKPSGWLNAREGGQGWIEVKDQAALRRMLGATGADIAGQIQQQIAGALGDFEVQKFSAQLLEDAKGSLLKIEIAGQARKGDERLVIRRLTVNVRGLEVLLEQSTRIQRWVEQRKQTGR